MEVATAVAPAIVEGVGNVGAATYAWLMEKIASSKNMEEIREHLEAAVTRLGAKRNDYQYKVKRSKTKMPSQTYDVWCHNVMKIENEVKKVVSRHGEKRKRTSFSQSFSRADFSEEMKKLGNKVIKLLEQGNQFQEFLVDRLPERVEKMKAPDINRIETRREALNKIVNWLKNDKVKGIGIYGTLGIGKTVIMLNLNNHEEVAKMFDIVIWLKVSTEESNENLSREHLQKAIMQRLKLDIEGTNNADEVAKRILKELEDKKYLLLLDNIKEKFDLSEMGIPVPDGKNGSKIVLTTRLPDVFICMDVDRTIKVSSLSNKEPWKMFQDVLQCPTLIKDSKKVSLAIRLCKDCGGHPLLIKTVAKIFKVKNKECLWADGLNSWRVWPERGCQGMREFYKLLEKFCYDQLDDGMKKCFLYGALYPEDSDIYIDYLLDCWAAENFLKRENPYLNGHAILDHLKNVSLLEEGNSGEYVTMHKCFREAALDISSNDPECKYLVKNSGALREPPDVESWKQKNRISITNHEFKKLPDCPNCSMLSTLFLQKNLGLKIIPASFFDLMESLRVLDFSHTGITSLPPSLSKLINLKVLNLSECKYLVELASQIVELGHLETLDIRGSGVNSIPPHIGNLRCLRHLRVSFSKSGNENGTQVGFNHHIISKLSRLEALVVDVKSLDQWPTKVVEEIIKEVAPLENFRSLKFFFSNEVVDVIEVVPSTLRIDVPEADILQTFINKSRSWRKVQSINSFQFFIGCKNSRDPQIPKRYLYERYIKYCDGEGCNPSILEVPVKADAFELVNHKDIKQLSDFGSMNEVRGCLVKSCNTIETIVGTADSVVLQNLEEFYVMKVPRLECIWKSPMRPGSLSKLQILVLSGCPMLIKIFPHGVIQQLTEIQYLKIEDCSGIEEIISEADIVANGQVLPKLEELTLLNMPRLKSICANKSLDWPSLEKLKIYECSSLRELPFNKDNARKLHSIKAEKDWWAAMADQEIMPRGGENICIRILRGVRIQIQKILMGPIPNCKSPPPGSAVDGKHCRVKTKSSTSDS